ncbi:MAG: septum site-determining protein MinC [Caldilineaceae bacterium]
MNSEDHTTTPPASSHPLPSSDHSSLPPFDATAANAAAPLGDLGGALATAVNIKGRAGGVLIEIGRGNWSDLMHTLTDHLTRSASFFRNGKVALDLAARPLNEQELRQIHQLLSQYDLHLGLVRTASNDTFQIALALGLAAQLENAEGQPVATAQPTLSNLTQEQHFVYSGHLRAGQVLQRSEHILVIGDVNPGATVVSDGDILVWGHLRGVAHAGATGDGRAVIVALDLAPVQLRIADFIAIAPEAQTTKGWGPWKQPIVKQPEIAYLADDRIVVEPWNATKFGGIASFRR